VKEEQGMVNIEETGKANKFMEEIETEPLKIRVTTHRI
jgi:hypothetical protein